MIALFPSAFVTFKNEEESAIVKISPRRVALIPCRELREKRVKSALVAA